MGGLALRNEITGQPIEIMKQHARILEITIQVALLDLTIGHALKRPEPLHQKELSLLELIDLVDKKSRVSGPNRHLNKKADNVHNLEKVALNRLRVHPVDHLLEAVRQENHLVAALRGLTRAIALVVKEMAEANKTKT